MLIETNSEILEQLHHYFKMIAAVEFDHSPVPGALPATSTVITYSEVAVISKMKGSRIV